MENPSIGQGVDYMEKELEKHDWWNNFWKPKKDVCHFANPKSYVSKMFPLEVAEP